MKARELDKLLNCNCDVCDFKRYDPEDCDIHRKKAILLALKEMVLSRIDNIKIEPARWGSENQEVYVAYQNGEEAFKKKAIDSVAGLFTEDNK